MVLGSSLVVVFASFGSSTPRNLLPYRTILPRALSIASIVHVILDLDGPFSGVFMVSSGRLRNSLVEIS